MNNILSRLDITKSNRGRSRITSVDMTEGSIAKHILRLSMPLLMVNFLQQLYVVADAWVVGNFASNEAFSAVGIVTPIVNMMIGLFSGVSTGAGIVISQYYGARQRRKVKEVVHTAITAALILSLTLTVLGIVGVPWILEFMNVPEEIMSETRTYLTLYLFGLIGLAIHNMGTSILGAVGDPRRPVFFLISVVLNAVLDLLFVIVFNMGIAGVALATVLAQSASAVLVVIALMRDQDCIRFIPDKLGINGELLGKILKIGVPAALQLIVVSTSELFVQRYVNNLNDADLLSGYTAYTRIEEFLLLPLQALSVATTTLVGQNVGYSQRKRARRGTLIALGFAAAFTLVLVALTIRFTPALVGFFNDKAEVIEYGTILLRVISPFYLLCCLIQIFMGSVSGSGRTFVPMIILISSFIGARQLYLFVVTRFVTNTIVSVGLAYPVGWICAAIAIVFYYILCEFDTEIIAPSDEQSEIEAK